MILSVKQYLTKSVKSTNTIQNIQQSHSKEPISSDISKNGEQVPESQSGNFFIKN